MWDTCGAIPPSSARVVGREVGFWNRRLELKEDALCPCGRYERLPFGDLRHVHKSVCPSYNE